MWPFKRKQEPPEEIAGETRLDEATREVAWDEFDKEADREAGNPFAPLGIEGAMSAPVKGDPDPGEEHAVRDALRDDAD